MAFSSSIKKGQVQKCCELCETEIKITFKCINCKLFMCTKCTEKIHSKFQSADKHKILDIKQVGVHSEELDFSNISCQDHEGQICVMFCKSCDQLVCTQCIAKVHNGHELVDINEGYKHRIENVKEGQKQIKVHMANIESKIKLLRKSENSKYQETRNAIEAHSEALKRAVDKHTEILIAELDQKWETLQNAIDQEEKRFTVIKTRKEDESTKANDIVNSKNAEEVFRESKNFAKTIIESVKPVEMDFNIMPKFLPGEISEHTVGSLQDVPKDLVMKVVQQFTTDIDNIYLLSTCSDNSLWISDKNVVQRVKPEGNNLKVLSVISNLNMKIYDMAVTPSNDLLLATNGSKLKQIGVNSEQVTDSVYSVDPLIPSAVHVTSDYNVIVGAHYGAGRVVVIKMNKEGKHEKTYEHDRNKQPIFTYVYHITTTTSGTIFVVDKLSDEYRGRLVVLGQDGDVLNTYTGDKIIKSKDKPFKPRRVVTTPFDNIIVSDPYVSTLHILNNVGNLMQFYKMYNIGILHPLPLSFTYSGQLYIGCCTPADNTDKAKLYEVDISQI